MRASPPRTNRSRPCRARSMIRGTNWVSPGPQIRCGRSATVASAGPLAASTSCSARALVAGYGAGNRVAYGNRSSAPYPATKARAEQLVLAANGPALATVALRPHLIWGPGDTQLAPRIIERARQGRLRFVRGGDALIDSTYVDNAAAAHLLALDRVAPGAACAGRAYFISQGEPRPLRDLVNAILAAAGLPPAT